VRSVLAVAAALVLAPTAGAARLFVDPGELSADGGTVSIAGSLPAPRRVGVEVATWRGQPLGWLSPPTVRRLIRLPWHGRLAGRRLPDGFYHVRLVDEDQVLAMAPVRIDSTPPRLRRFRITNEDSPFAGDGRLLATVSPNGDGLRDRVRIEFTLSETARVDLQLAATKARLEPVAMRSRWFPAGRRSFVWTPPSRIVPSTYVTRLTAVDRAGNRTTYGKVAGAVPGTPVIHVQGIDAGFSHESYAPGEIARLVVSTDARVLTLQLFRSGPESSRPRPTERLRGKPAAPPVTFTWRGRRSAPSRIKVAIPQLETGFYFARLQAPDGREGYAPFVVRPPQLGANQVAVVLPTFTWQAYNFRDEDGNGWGDTWYAGVPNETVRLGRPYQNRGVPPHFRAYDLGFLHWLAWWRHGVDYLADSDLSLISSGEQLARLYDLVIFPGHEEYVTTHMYDLIEDYRDLGGNLMFLSADNFYWRVVRRGQVLRRTEPWRELGRPEAALIGAQYRGNNGSRRKAFVVVNFGAAPWLFSDTGLTDGSTFGLFGIEIDAKAPASPPGTRVLATLPHIFGPGFSAHMTYYETPAGAKVFAAGALGFAGSAAIRPVRNLLENLWNRLRSP
jgi:hypothetical protein